MVLLIRIDPVIPSRLSWPLAQPELPAGLSVTESTEITRQKSPKGRVDAALKLAGLRVGNALMLSQQSQYQGVTQHLETFANLVGYADDITRSIPVEKRNDRESCLKKIEQTIFRQTPRFESIIRDLPLEYREASAPFAERVRRVRLQAINDLLGGGAAIKVPDNQN
jgi:hypothetical protein